jgi:glycerol-3-phosphate dehydrogenase (NAD(P)+)
MRVTVIGAGYMGSAMAVVARGRGHNVRLWGTWLDDDLLAPCERGEPHPRLLLTLEDIMLMRSARLPEALEGAELVIHAVNSEGEERQVTDLPLLEAIHAIIWRGAD